MLICTLTQRAFLTCIASAVARFVWPDTFSDGHAVVIKGRVLRRAKARRLSLEHRALTKKQSIGCIHAARAKKDSAARIGSIDA